MNTGPNTTPKGVCPFGRSRPVHSHIPIEKGKTLTLAELKGPGQVTHIWFTINCGDKNYLRRLIFRAYWDTAKTRKGIILGPSHSIAYGVPYDNFLAMMDEFHKTAFYS